MEEVLRKFEAYCTFTTDCRRSVPMDQYFIYPDESMQSDTLFLTALLFELFERSKDNFMELFQRYSTAFQHLSPLVTKFWTHGGKCVTELNPEKAEDMKLLMEVLSGGFRNFQYRYGDVSSREYLKSLALGHELEDTVVDDEINASNYLCYLVHADQSNNVHVLKTHFAKFRYHLHFFFSVLRAVAYGTSTACDCFDNKLTF